MPNAQSQSSPYLLIPEAAELARAPVSTIRYWIEVGKLPSTRPGRRRLIRRQDLIAFIESGETEAA